eukprot:CAMPEP_0172496000 /NCGR_PEP_ID=MMETSP1066-20121228/79785_1 /TAXON_ID=671091 /ORGANISM="Coscinodiscus wailesii, Strain CCMP2513" /LENGTH=81 /DNA_ID=CAMNT_0013268045 /DNA_START=131 /DNA_END=373 /DNA_ORIENTATION=-
MGNNPSNALAIAGAKRQFDAGFKSVKDAVGLGDKQNVKPKDDAQKAQERKERNARQAEREKELAQKKKEREAKKGSLLDRW